MNHFPSTFADHCTACTVPPKHHTKTTSEKVLQVIEKISLVAIGIFAAITLLEYFVPAFALGAAIGIWTGSQQVAEADHNHDHSVCSHAFLEHLTGVKLPLPLGLATNIAILAAHIDHHAPVFVPLVGVTIGMWAGKLVSPPISAACRKVVQVVVSPCVPDYNALVRL